MSIFRMRAKRVLFVFPLFEEFAAWSL